MPKRQSKKKKIKNNFTSIDSVKSDAVQRYINGATHWQSAPLIEYKNIIKTHTQNESNQNWILGQSNYFQTHRINCAHVLFNEKKLK